VVFICFGVVLGCSTDPAIKDVRFTYTAIRNILRNNIPGGIRKESPNGNTLTSEYFSGGDIDQDPLPKSDRSYAVITVLGSSRPFSIDVHVFREPRVGNSYGKPVEDKSLGKKVVERIRAALADRREDRNIIDDVRPF
jgi:hypothetical protein